jgi:lipopolysaccharide transport system permease protein
VGHGSLTAAEGNLARAKGYTRISAEAAPVPEQLGDLVRARNLFTLLLERELQVRYKQTAVGIGWVVLQPLIPAVIFAVVFGAFARLPTGGTPYFEFALSGLVLFGLFSSAVSRSSTSFIRDGQLITKVRFPHSILPLAAGSAAMIDFAVGLLLLLVVMIVSGEPFTARLFALPVIVGWTLLLGLAVGLPLAAVSARLRDFAIAVPFALQVALYASPVAYSSDLVPASFRTLMSLNPLVGLIESFRSVLFGTAGPESQTLLLGTIASLLIVAGGMFIYGRASRDIADVI